MRTRIGLGEALRLRTHCLDPNASLPFCIIRKELSLCYLFTRQRDHDAPRGTAARTRMKTRLLVLSLWSVSDVQRQQGMSGRKEVGVGRQEGLDELKGGQTGFFLPQVTPIYRSDGQRVFGFLEENAVLFVQACALFQDQNHDKNPSLLSSAQAPSCPEPPSEHCKHRVLPQAPMEKNRAQSGRRFLSLRRFCSPSWEPKPFSGWAAMLPGRHKPLGMDATSPPKDPWENVSMEHLEPLTFAIEFPIFVSNIRWL